MTKRTMTIPPVAADSLHPNPVTSLNENRQRMVLDLVDDGICMSCARETGPLMMFKIFTARMIRPWRDDCVWLCRDCLDEGARLLRTGASEWKRPVGVRSL